MLNVHFALILLTVYYMSSDLFEVLHMKWLFAERLLGQLEGVNSGIKSNGSSITCRQSVAT